ncbi:ABC transporter permease [Ochrobactrum sp. WV_118_8]
MLKSLWQYRNFILSSIRGELKGRFARSYLGGAWFILHPLAQALIFSIVLSEVMRARLPTMDNSSAYPIYLLSGMAAWGLFSEILNRSISVFVDQASVLKKIAFPRLCLPIIIWGTAIINHVLLLAAIGVIFAFFGHNPNINWLYLIIGILIISSLAFGLGVFLGVLNVFVRDIGQVMIVIMQLWFWLTPIVYVSSVVPENLRALIDYNPMTGLVSLYQNVLLLDQPPTLISLLPSSTIAVIAIIISFYLFRKASPELVDAI